jgi:tetratricopeptide (TPR) repeat protein
MPDESLTRSPKYLRRVNAALALREVPDYEAALLQLTYALELAPEDMSVLLLLGLTHRDLGQLDLAEEKLRQAYAIAPDSNQVIQSLGLLLVERNQYEEALALLESLLKAGVHDPAVSLGTATALERLGRDREAIDVLDRAQSHFPEDPGLMNQLGHLLIGADRIEEAEQVLAAATELDANPENLLDLAIVFLRQERPQQAVSAIEQAVELAPKDDRLWRIKTNCLLELGKLQQANEAARMALSLDNDDPRNWHTLAQTQFALEEYDKAFDAFERSVKFLQGGSEEGGLKFVLLDRSLKTLQAFGVSRALDVIEQDLIILPGHEELRQLQINMLLATSRYSEALSSLDEASQLELTLREGQWNYFHACYGLNRPEEAWSKLPPIPDSPGEYRGYLQGLEATALSLYQSSNVLAAQEIFQRVLDIEPTQARSLNNLGFILTGDERWEQAIDLFERTLYYLKEGQEDSSMLQDVALANLGYAYLRQHRYDEALRYFEQAEKAAKEGDRAILRIAYWLKNEFSLGDQERFPRRFIESMVAIRANLAITYLLKGELSKSLDVAQSIVDKNPKNVIGYRVLGCIYFSADDPRSARNAWEQALKTTRSKSERRIIETWLDTLPSLGK